MAVIYVDGKPYTVKDGQNLLHACLGLGFNIPYFCWHPALGSVGACRQCAVKQFKDAGDTRGKIVLACMTPAAEGTRISIDDPEAREFRAGVLEWLMINHPHDCPVCDEGGECHLQDMTVMTGHTLREFDFPKRTFRNQELGPFLTHEMNRCIHCYRCVRFYRDYAGGRDFSAFAAHDHVYFGRMEDGVLENEFSGNLVEVCPTGVFTDKTFRRHYTRKWDLQTAPSICVHCALGCNTIAGGRYGSLRRILNRYNGEVNGYFLCDRGRYGYEFIESGARIRSARIRKDKAAAPGEAGRAEALKRAAEMLGDRHGVIGIGSPRASLESNYALRRLVGPDRFFQGVSEEDYRTVGLALRILQTGPARSPSLKEVRAADAALVLGEDVTNSAPILALALRQLVRSGTALSARRLGIPGWNDAAVRELAQDEKEMLYLATPAATKLEDAASRALHAAPDDLARFGWAVAHEIDPEAPGVAGLPEEAGRLAAEVARVLLSAERPLVVSGTGCGSPALLEAAANVAWALCRKDRPALLSFVLPEANSLGLGLMGGGDPVSALRMLREGRADTAVILENDLYRSAESADVDAALRAAKHVIVIDHVEHPTAGMADMILPSATFAEDSGTLISSEGRAQRFYQVLLPHDEVQSGWRWLRDMDSAAAGQAGGGWRTLDAIDADIAREFPVFGPILEIAPPADFLSGGQKIPRQSARYSGRTAIDANADVNEPKPPTDPDSPLGFSMEGEEGRPPPALITRYWDAGWNSVQAVNKFQAEIGGALSGGDPGRRLIEAPAGTRAEYFGEAPPAFEPQPEKWLLVPLYHIFGSEPLSMLSPAIAGLAGAPYLALRPDEAAGRGAAEGDLIRVACGGRVLELPVRLLPSLPAHVAGLPAGFPDLARLALPAIASLTKKPRENGNE